MRTIVVVLGLAVALQGRARPAAAADGPAFPPLDRAYAEEVRPLFARYCGECHSAERAEADVDLSAFAALADVRKRPETWQRVGEMLESGQMPPRKARQPSDAERGRLRDWVRGYLSAEAEALAGDPGRVVLRRLSNAEYTHTVRDLTGVDALDPAREFPVDGAAGEGFTNTGDALVMSPSLVTKYLDSAKDVAGHAVLLPAGLRFSPKTTPRDWTEETLAGIRDFYREFTDPGGGERVNLQGVVFDTNQGGRLPVETYLAATVAARGDLARGRAGVEAVARDRGLNARYLGTLWATLTADGPSLVLDGLRARWRDAGPGEVGALAAEVAAWQKALWKFNAVGQIGRRGGPKAWQEPVNPLAPRQDVRVPVPESADGVVTLRLVATAAAGDGGGGGVVWQEPRLVAPGRPDLLLRDVRAVARGLSARRDRVLPRTADYLAAVEEAGRARDRIDAAGLARGRGLDADALTAWLEYLGVGSAGELTLTGHLAGKLTGVGGHDFVNGWGRRETPLVLANASDRAVRVPGNMAPHGVAVHPSPTLKAAVGWLSPVTTLARVEGTVAHAHPECGNGVTWSLERRRGTTRVALAAGVARGGKGVAVGPVERLDVRAGDLVSLLVGSRGGNHACDLTAVELKVTGGGGDGQAPAPEWDLGGDVSGDVLAGNPHADRAGRPGVWHFYAEPDAGEAGGPGPVVPPGSLLARWRDARDPAEARSLAVAVQDLLTGGPPAGQDHPDARLYRQLTALSSPLLRGARVPPDPAGAGAGPDWGLDPGLFEGGAGGGLRVGAPSVTEVRLPGDLVAGAAFVSTARAEGAGAVQLAASAGRPDGHPAPLPAVGLRPGAPVLAEEGGPGWARVEAAFGEFRRVFPPALCYAKIVPVDEVITLTLFYREDDHLARLMLDDRQKARLDALWDELHYLSRDPLTQVDAFAQLLEYASQDGDPSTLEPLRQPINDRAAAFRRRLAESEPRHLDALSAFAERAYRRPLSGREAAELRDLYRTFRGEGMPHDESVRLVLARVLVAPAFLYRLEAPGPGPGQAPVSAWELASRLSYFLWSGPPDDRLRGAAASGRLTEPAVLSAEAGRMLRDPKARRLAVEFGCQWLHVRDFDQLDEKSERHFPDFAGLRGAMYEESVRFFTDLFRNDRPVLDLLDADATFLNDDLARYYGIPPGPGGEGWRRVVGVKRFGRGGVLAQASTLARQSGASRTSPTLRGHWVSEVLLGERLPRPPKGVPQLPDDEAAAEGLTVRQLVEAHARDPKCAACHRRIDPLGFALEGYDAVGRRRGVDLAGRPVDARTAAADGTPIDGLDGLRTYLVTARADAFRRQFCRKLLGYALGRSVRLSDEPLLAAMQAGLRAEGRGVSTAVEAVVLSRQFREIRGRDWPAGE